MLGNIFTFTDRNARQVETYLRFHMFNGFTLETYKRFHGFVKFTSAYNENIPVPPDVPPRTHPFSRSHSSRHGCARCQSYRFAAVSIAVLSNEFSIASLRSAGLAAAGLAGGAAAPAFAADLAATAFGFFC